MIRSTVFPTVGTHPEEAGGWYEEILCPDN